MSRSLWRSLARPAYLVSAGPWQALLALVSPVVVWSALAVTLLGGFAGALVLLGQGSRFSPSVSLVVILFLLVAPAAGLLSVPLVALWFGYTERWRLRLMGFTAVADPHVPMPVRPLRRWLVFRYQEPATWREVLSAVLSQAFCLLVLALLTVESAVLAVLVYCLVLLSRGQPVDRNLITPWEAAGEHGPVGPVQTFTPDSWWIFALLLLLGLVVSGYVNGLVAAASGSVSKALLAPRPEEMQRQVERLTFSRAAIMDSFEAERRRIERDLHDGVQQELVNLSLRLGLVEMELGSLKGQGADTRATAHQLREAQNQTSHALQTLRNTVRGIYPAVLEDHGLRAALEELANNCLLPARLDYALAQAPPPDLARTAYYAVSEAMTNALKHSGASCLEISVRSADGQLAVEVLDDGCGGVDAARGSGIAGLDERARALGGRVDVDSPAGGPTRLVLRLPWDTDRPDPRAPGLDPAAAARPHPAPKG